MVTETDSHQQQEHKDSHQTDGNASFLRAARAGNLDKVLEYLKGSIDINTSNANGLNALHLASKEGHVSVVTELLKRGANVNAATKKGNTALHIASLAGQLEVVKVLILNGADVNVQSLNGFSPLYMAAQENHDSVVRYLLTHSANQSLATEDGFTPLAVALQQGHDKVVAVLLENDTKGKVRLPALHVAAKKDDCKAAALLLQNDHNPDVTSKSGFTPLHIASHYGNENIAALLLDKNADVNFVAKHQITPIHVAAKWGKVNMVSLLLDRKAKIEAATRDGLTPLHCAARSGHETVVDLLLERGAPISAKTKNGLAPLHMSAQGDHVDSARILLIHKAPVDDITVDYLTALHVAAHCGHVRVAKLLLERKADPNARALNGFTPLHIACKKNRIKVVELLLKHGASIEATTESGLTPLHVAAFMGCMNIVIYLIQHLANPDVPTVRGETPLHLAARANQTDIIRILLRNGAQVDAKAREQQTPLHIASRLGNVDIVGLLLQHGADVNATTKDMYTPLHIAAKEGQEEVAAVLLEHGASLNASTKKGFTPLHLAAKYGNIKVARLLISKDAPVDAQGKNNVTPLHCAAHYDHVNVALLLLEKGASPHATAKNGYCPLHIAARKNQMDIATTLLEYGAKANAESKAGFTPLHLAAQEGHTDMATLLIGHQANVDQKSKNLLTPLHLCSQEDRVNVATILARNRVDMSPQTKAGYTPLHVAAHFGQLNMVRFLLQNGADVNATNAHGYTPLHQSAQQGHTAIVNTLLEHKASPNSTTNQGQTALSIAQRLGYISVVETLKIVTTTVVSTTTTTVTEEKYKVVSPETMHETFMSDSEDEGGEEFLEEPTLYSGNQTHSSHVFLPFFEAQNQSTMDDHMGDQSYRYLTADEMKSLGDDSLPFDVTKDERSDNKDSLAPITVDEELFSPHHMLMTESYVNALAPDNIDISRAPITAGTFTISDMEFPHTRLWRFSIRPLEASLRMRRRRRLKWKTFLVSFMVDARGGAMRGCRHSGVRVIIPPRKAPMPMRITCRYIRKEKLIHPPPLMEGEACASRLLEVGPAGAKFLGPVIIEVPHFASLRGKEREIIILRSDNGENWREHTLEASEEAVQEVLNESFEGENDVNTLDDFSSNRITRILTTDFPQYFAVITRIRQEVHAIGPEGGMVSSTVVPQVQAIFPEGALTKKIKVGLQAQPIPTELVTKMLGNRIAVSPICTIEPRRRKFHKPITLTIPVPQAATRGMINQYTGDAPTLRLLCSITGSTKSGGTTRAQWEDVTGSTPLTFVNDCVSFTTTVSARFWLIDCRQVTEATKFATELYSEAIHVPFMSKFVVFAKRYDPLEAQLRVFCMTDDKEEKTLENQEHFTEVAKSRDVEVLESKPQFLEFAGNLVPVTKSGEQLSLTFQAFRENRLPFVMRVKDPNQEPLGRIAFMRENKRIRGSEPTQQPICNLNIELPDICREDVSDVSPNGFNHFDKQYVLSTPGMKSRTGAVDTVDQNGFDSKPHSGPKRDISRGPSLGREVSLDVSYDEQDIMKEAESAEESESDAGMGERGRSRQSSETDQQRRDDSEREIAAQKFLEFLEEQDKEDSEERAKYRGEDSSLPQDLFVVTEEMEIPSKRQLLNEEPTEIRTTEMTTVLEDGSIKHTITAVTKTTVVQDPEEMFDNQTRHTLECETWPSEQDTSQVSLSSLPEDEKSESTATVSSTTTTNTGDNIASALVTTSVEDEPHFDAIVEQKEWTEEDESGCVQHIIEQTSTIITDESDAKSKSSEKQFENIIETNALGFGFDSNSDQKQNISISFPTSLGIKDNENDSNDNEDSDSSFLPKPSPPETADVSDEQLSPVCDYSNYMSADNQVKVGISPTDELLSNSRAYETQQTIDSNNLMDLQHKIGTELSASDSESAYENNAFAGTENIDTIPTASEPRSPYEVVRGQGFESHFTKDFADDKNVPKNRRSVDKDSDEDIGSDGKSRKPNGKAVIDRELEGKVKKQIVNEIFAKELNEEVVNGSPERKVILKVDIKTANKGVVQTKPINALDDKEYEEIRREAQIIAENIVIKAKEELARSSQDLNISSEISDEDLVEFDDQEVNQLEIDSISPTINSTEPTEVVSPLSPDPSKTQKRISFTEKENLFLKSDEKSEKSSIVLEKNISPEELKRTLSHPQRSVDSGSRSGSGKEKESGSSSSSHYHSFEVSDSSKTPANSRPTSSEFDLCIIPEQIQSSSSRSSGAFGTSPSQYDTCTTSQDGSYMTAAGTSQETSYHTARTSLCSHESSRDSTISIESESSGHLGEMSSEASETLVTEEDKERNSSDDEPTGSLTPVNEFKEPFDYVIPEAVIRGGLEMPFMSTTNWESMAKTTEDTKAETVVEVMTIEDEMSNSNTNTNRSSHLVSNNSLDESEQNSENSNTWHSSSVGTAINVTGHPSAHSSLTSLGQSGCGESQFRSITDSIGSFEALNNTEVQQNTETIEPTESSSGAQYSNGPVEVDYNPEYDVSEFERTSTQSSAVTLQAQSSVQEETTRTSSSDTPLISQSSFCSSILSEQTRHQLSYDLSPDLHLGTTDSLTTESDDSQQRPLSPVPPFSEELVFLESTQDKSPSAETSDLSPSVEQHSELYTHQEVDEDVEESPTRASLGSRLSQSKAIPFPASKSGESSAASSLKEFERLESEMRSKGSHHGSSDSLGSFGSLGRPLAGKGSDRDDQSVSSSINEFEKLEKDCSEAERIEKQAQEEAVRLSEIEEGHESQASDVSQETLSGHEGSSGTDSDYEKRMSEIEDLMKITEKSVKKMHSMSKQGFDNSITTDNIRDDKLLSQSSSASVAQLLLTKKVMSTDSMDSHPRSSISTTNTESLIDRIEDLDEIRVEYKDDNKSMSSDSMHEELKDEFSHELEALNEGMAENTSAKSSQSSSITHAISYESGPALATLREETDFDDDSLKDSFHGAIKAPECMLSSTDSLEIRAEVGSAMSSSYLTSGDESTMISSTETSDLLFNTTPDPLDSEQSQEYFNKQNQDLRRLFDNEIKSIETQNKSTDNCGNNKTNEDNEDEYEEVQTVDERGNYVNIKRMKRTVPPQQRASSSSDTEERFLEKLRQSAEAGSELIEEERGFDQFGNVVIKRTVRTESTQGPELRSKLVTGETAQRDTEEFLEPFTKLQTFTNIDEYEGTDESGNAYQVYQEVTVTPEVRAVTFSGADAQQKLDEFLQTWTGDKEQLIEINKQYSETDSMPKSNSSDSKTGFDDSNDSQNDCNYSPNACYCTSHDFRFDFGKQNGKRNQNNGNSSFTGNTRVLTETVSESDGHTTVMETTIFHSQQESDPFRESMSQILEEFMAEESSAVKKS